MWQARAQTEENKDRNVPLEGLGVKFPYSIVDADGKGKLENPVPSKEDEAPDTDRGAYWVDGVFQTGYVSEETSNEVYLWILATIHSPKPEQGDDFTLWVQLDPVAVHKTEDSQEY